MDQNLEKLLYQQSFKYKQRINNEVEPQIFDLAKKQQKKEFLRLLESQGDRILVVNELDIQLKELMKIRHPKEKLTEEELLKKGEQHLQGTPKEEYGVWVYYPWKRKIIHLLPEEEFVEVRTARNRYKITEGEQEELASKVVGIIGLSVGQSVAITMAIERTFGLLKIADFDHLELSNLNRIRRGLDALTLPKTVIVAQEIKEIDPFLQVEIFKDGINDNNLEAFFGGDSSNLDILIEECDSLDVKVKARTEARKRKVPVIMDTSDRGLVDIERFDLEPDRLLFHGLVEEKKLSNLKNLTTEEKIPVVLSMVGINQVSTRFKASLLEIDNTVTTWPQLASAVTLGGAVSADTARRILLGESVKSGRYYLDLRDHLPSIKKEEKVEIPVKPKALTFNYIKKFLKDSDDGIREKIWQDDIVRPDFKIIRDIVENACHAPSGGNVQPWKWVLKEGLLYLFHDRSKSFSFLDYNDLGSQIAFGAAIENLRQRAAFHKLGCVAYYDADNFPLIAVVKFVKSATTKKELFFGSNLKIRLTNRKQGEPLETLSEKEKTGFKGVLTQEDEVNLKITETRIQIDKLAFIIGEMERIRILHPWGHNDFINEARWNKKEAEETRDGVDLRTLDLSESDKTGLNLISDQQAVSLLRKWDKGEGLIEMGSKSVKASSNVALIYFNSKGGSWLKAGEALERLWLYANHQGIAFQPVSPATFMIARALDNDNYLSKNFRKKIIELRRQLLEVYALPNDVEEVFLFRLFKASDPKVKSLRYPLENVYREI